MRFGRPLCYWDIINCFCKVKIPIFWNLFWAKKSDILTNFDKKWQSWWIEILKLFWHFFAWHIPATFCEKLIYHLQSLQRMYRRWNLDMLIKSFFVEKSPNYWFHKSIFHILCGGKHNIDIFSDDIQTHRNY